MDKQTNEHTIKEKEQTEDSKKKFERKNERRKEFLKIQTEENGQMKERE